MREEKPPELGKAEGRIRPGDGEQKKASLHNNVRFVLRIECLFCFANIEK